MADPGCPGVGPAWSLGQKGVPGLLDLFPPGAADAQRGMFTPRQYTHHPRCPHLVATLQQVVEDVAMPMTMPGLCSRTSSILIRGPGGTRAGAAAAPAPQVEVYPTKYGDVVQVIIPPTVYETVPALGCHHLGDLSTEDYRVKRERALKERAPTCTLGTS